MKTISELKEIRVKSLNEISMRTNREAVRVVVKMGTSGILAGAPKVLNAFLKEIKNKDLHDVYVSVADCAGDNELEPIVFVIDKDGKKTTYVNMNPEKVAKVVEEQIVNR